MQPVQLIETLTAAGCRLIPDGDKLRVQDPHRALPDALRDLVRQHKDAILALVRDTLVLPATTDTAEVKDRHACLQNSPDAQNPATPLQTTNAAHDADGRFAHEAAEPRETATARRWPPATRHDLPGMPMANSLPQDEPPPPDLIGNVACPHCGSRERWRWLDGRLLCRDCLIRGEPPVLALKVWSEDLQAALWVVADELPHERWPHDAPVYTQGEVKTLTRMGADTVTWVHPVKELFNARVMERRPRTGGRQEPHAGKPRRVRGHPTGETAAPRSGLPPPGAAKGPRRPKGGVTLELPYDRVIHQFFEEHPEWKTSTAVVERYDRQANAHVVGLTAAALDALLQYVPAGATCLSVPERHFYATMFQWLIDHGVSRVVHTPYRQPNAPETLPGQLGLFD